MTFWIRVVLSFEGILNMDMRAVSLAHVHAQSTQSNQRILFCPNEAPPCIVWILCGGKNCVIIRYRVREASFLKQDVPRDVTGNTLHAKTAG